MTQPLRAPDPRFGVQPLPGRPRPAAGRRLAAAGRPRLRRPHPVGAAAERLVVVRGPGAPAHRADQPAGGPGRRGGRTASSPSPSSSPTGRAGRSPRASPTGPGAAPRRREVIPVRHDGVVVAVLAKDTNLAVTRSPSTLELTYLDIAADLCLMVSAGTFPPQKPQDAEMSPRVGDGLVRLDGAGRVTYASPNALSAYRRIGVDRRPRRRRPGRAHPRRAAADRVAGEAVAAGHRRGGGRAVPRPMDVEGAHRHDARPGAARCSAPGGEAGRARAGARRHRRPPARPGAADQGRDDPGDPPPGEEQPADGRRAAAAAGAADDRAGRAGGAGGVGAPGRLDRGRARDAGRQPGGRRRRGRRAGPGAADARRPGLRRPGRRAPGASASFGELPAAAATPLVLAVTELLHNAAEHAFPEGEPGHASSWSPSGTATTSSSGCGTTAAGCRRASTRRQRRAGAADRADAGHQRAGRQPAHGPARPGRAPGTEVVLDPPRRRAAPPLTTDAEAGPGDPGPASWRSSCGRRRGGVVR